MRTPITSVITALSLALIGCSSGGVVVVRQPPAPTPVPVVVMEPLEIDVARPHNGKLFVQTNRPAYVAIFEIVPERGVALVYPTSPRQRRFVVSGLRELPVWWQTSRVAYNRGMSSSRSHPTRYIYAIASDEPLRIPDAAFEDRHLDDMIGNRAYRGHNPYATMRALARRFVPSVADEAWAEDAYAVSASYATERYRVARVYCRGGTVYEVPVELADRVWCPSHPRGAGDGPGRFGDVDVPGSRRPLVRPDSMVGDNGRRVAVRPHGPNGRGRPDRVNTPPGVEHRGESDDANDDQPGNGPKKSHPDDRGDGRPAEPNDGRESTPRSIRREAMNDATPAPMQAERSAKADGPGRRESSGKPDGSAKPAAGEEVNPSVKAETKPQSPGEKGSEQKKGRGQSDPTDEKPAQGKSKTKPLG